MEHPDWPAFMAAIVANPDDDTVRLVAADFLEENGDADRAAFIRIQVELARLEAAGLGKSLEVDHLRAKERVFLGPLSERRSLWGAEECPEFVTMPRGVTVEGAGRLTWRRGFIEGVTCPAEMWARHGTAVRKRLPIRSVTLTGCDQVGRGQWYSIIPVLKRLQLVVLQGADQATGQWLKGWFVEGEELIVL
jgi:uncharacterized protein (TIGR02996 family)